jgi:hypothetical protein
MVNPVQSSPRTGTDRAAPSSPYPESLHSCLHPRHLNLAIQNQKGTQFPVSWGVPHHRRHRAAKFTDFHHARTIPLTHTITSPKMSLLVPIDTDYQPRIAHFTCSPLLNQSLTTDQLSGICRPLLPIQPSTRHP